MNDTATYKGWTIEIRDDLGDEEVTKLGHEVTKGDENKFLDLSPYGTWDFDLCAAMIDLGFPTRKNIDSIGPLRREDVEDLWRSHFGNYPMPKAET